jgi:hypothetical protein
VVSEVGFEKPKIVSVCGIPPLRLRSGQALAAKIALSRALTAVDAARMGHAL